MLSYSFFSDMPHIPPLNQQELDYLQDTHFLLTKRKITQQLQQLLAKTQQELHDLLKQHKQHLPPHCLQRAGKISRGENYKGLPYLILDYPRLLTKDDVFAFRTMFWWGNFFSCSLQLQGKSLTLYRSALNHKLITHKSSGLYICVNSTPWEYHYGTDNYQLLESLQEERINHLLEQDFCKISRKTGLENYAELPSFALNCAQEYLDLLST